jgi:hypothetical protein
MNNTKTLAIVAILTAATLVVGVTFAAATTPTALAAYGHKKGGNDKKDRERDNGSANGNTDTAQIEKQKASVSGFDNTAEQEAQNLICTHPSSNCVSEGSETNSTDTADNGGE